MSNNRTKRMERNTPRRTSHTSTSDLLAPSQLPPPESPAAGHRSRQPSYQVGEDLRANQLTEEETHCQTKKKTCFGIKIKEMAGSGIFSHNADNTASETNSENLNNRTSIRVYQQALNGISQISFSTEERISPKKPTSVPEIAKQRELSETLESEPDTKSRRQVSSAKTEELSENDMFGHPPEIVPRTLPAPHVLESKESKDMGEPVPQNLCRSVEVSNPAGGQSNVLFGEETVKKSTSNKILDQKFAELMGNIFDGDVSHGTVGKLQSSAKLREMAGSDIFADGKAETREFLGARRTPGGGSSIALI